jgi:leucyl aminopeptidase
VAKLEITSGVIDDEILVVGLASKKKSLVIESGSVTIDSAALLGALEDLGATGAADEIIKVPGTSTRLIVFTGLGAASKKYSHEVLRRAAGAAARSLAGNKSATFALPASNKAGVAAVAEGSALGAYSFTEFRGSTKADQKLPLQNIAIHSSEVNKKEGGAIVARAMILAKYTHLVRDLINTPPSHLTRNCWRWTRFG